DLVCWETSPSRRRPPEPARSSTLSTSRKSYHGLRGEESMPMKETVTTSQHASTGPALPQLPEPSHAERIRTLISLASIGTLSTLSRKHPGFPFGSLMPFALDPDG